MESEENQSLLLNVYDVEEYDQMNGGDFCLVQPPRLIVDDFSCWTINHLVPNLTEIANCNFYWGKMDQCEAESMLADKPDGTFLMRDSSRGFPFLVSFRRHGKTEHYEIQKLHHNYGFFKLTQLIRCCDSIICRDIEYYKSMFTRPLKRNTPFSLTHLCRSTIVDRLRYDDVNQLPLPELLKNYLKEYRYSEANRIVDVFSREIWEWLGEFPNTW